MTADQVNALRAALAQPGTFIDPLPAESERKAIAEVTEKQPADTQPSNAADFSLQTSPPSVPPTTSPVAEAAPAAPSPAALIPAAPSANFGVSATQPAQVPSDNLAAGSTTQPSNNPAAMLDLVVVVRPTDFPVTQPAAAVPEVPTTAPAQPASPATQP